MVGDGAIPNAGALFHTRHQARPSSHRAPPCHIPSRWAALGRTAGRPRCRRRQLLAAALGPRPEMVALYGQARRVGATIPSHVTPFADLAARANVRVQGECGSCCTSHRP